MGKVKAASVEDELRKAEERNKEETEENTAALREETPVATSQQENNNSSKADAEDQESGKNEGEEEDVLKELVAVHPILYLSHQYKVGDKLPANNPEMVEAWIAAGTAVWSSFKGVHHKARMMTAVPGLPGQAVCPGTGGSGDLIGKVSGTGAGKR